MRKICLNDSILVLPGHYMDWKETNQELIFAETIGKIKEINAGLVQVDAEEADTMDLGKNECAASMHA
jgi:hypothetical protein